MHHDGHSAAVQRKSPAWLLCFTIPAEPAKLRFSMAQMGTGMKKNYSQDELQGTERARIRSILDHVYGNGETGLSQRLDSLEETVRADRELARARTAEFRGYAAFLLAALIAAASTIYQASQGAPAGATQGRDAAVNRPAITP